MLLLAFTTNARAQNFNFNVTSDALTTAYTTPVVLAGGQYGTTATIFLNVSTITTPDADDEVDFYIQTTYDGGTSWTDVENVHFATADDGNTATRIIVIDGAKDGPGTIQSITGTNPAAGSEITETVPANTIWKLTAAKATFVTDATAANRLPRFIIDDGTNIFVESGSTFAQTASTTLRYLCGEYGLAGTLVSGNQFVAVPFPAGVIMSGGYRFITTTGAIQAGDNYTAPQLSVEAWHDPRISTDATMGDNLKSYDRPLGSQIRIKTTVAGASAPTYAFSARGVFR